MDEQKDIESLKENIRRLTDDVTYLKGQCSDLIEENNKLKTRNSKLESNIEDTNAVIYNLSVVLRYEVTK